jgi:hypothetical protein
LIARDRAAMLASMAAGDVGEAVGDAPMGAGSGVELRSLFDGRWRMVD